jgi:hypothetical protein
MQPLPDPSPRPRGPAARLAAAVAGGLASLCVATSAAAALVLDNGAADATASPRGLSDTAPFSEAANDLPVFDADTTVAQLRFWGGYTGGVPAADAFTVRLYTATSQYTSTAFAATIDPQALVRSAQPSLWLDGIDASGVPVAVPVYEYLAPLAVTLAADTAYLLAIQNDAPDTDGAWLWAFASETLEQGAIRSSPQSLWHPVYGAYAFQLIGPDAPAGGALPVPGTLGLAALGLAGLSLRRRRRVR